MILLEAMTRSVEETDTYHPTELTPPFPLTFRPVALRAPSSSRNSPARLLGRFATGGLPIPGSYAGAVLGVSSNPNVDPSLI